jgi:hypothetical protein
MIAMAGVANAIVCAAMSRQFEGWIGQPKVAEKVAKYTVMMLVACLGSDAPSPRSCGALACWTQKHHFGKRRPRSRGAFGGEAGA